MIMSEENTFIQFLRLVIVCLIAWAIYTGVELVLNLL